MQGRRDPGRRGVSSTATATGSAGPDFADARWFPVDLQVPRREYQFLPIDGDVLERSAFLDTRIEAPLSEAVPVTVDASARAAMPAAPLGWLFHTSFCCSTLLARVLHVPPWQVVLKEPLVLRRLGDARHGHWPLQDLVDSTVRLLARPWDRGGAVVVKPTHGALNVAVELLAASPDSRGLILTSSLEDFLVSNIKKSPETQAKIPMLVERALQAGKFHERLPPGALTPPDLLAAASLQWAAQRELCLDIVTAGGPQRMRMVDASDLLANLQATAWQCAQWLQLPVPQQVLETRVGEVSQRNAKAVEAPYDAARRAADVRLVQARFANEIAAARRWFDRMVMPSMRDEAFSFSDHPCGKS